MPGQSTPRSAFGAAVEQRDDEDQPLLDSLSRIRAMPQKKVGQLCAVAVVAGLALAWYIVDAWNHDVSAQLFSIGSLQKLHIDPAKREIAVQSLQPFEFPLTLAFMQFAFMGFVFLGLWWVTTKHAASDCLTVWRTVTDKRWGGLVSTHVLSTFWLQALMLPANTMSLGAFATSRMVEVPTAAILRGQVMGGNQRMARFGGHPLPTVALMSGAAWLMTYAFTQIAECLCIFSGNGVALTGIPLYLIFGLVIITPAANVVCQEAVMVQLDTPPLLLLAMQNILACMLFAPVLLAAHFCGWENVGLAMQVTASSQEVCMLVLALSVQLTLLSAVMLGLIYMVDSFWAVALRSLRVAFYWLQMLFMFYFTSDTLLSVAHPHQALWSFVMCCGLVLAAVAVVADQKAHENTFFNFKGQANAILEPPMKV